MSSPSRPAQRQAGRRRARSWWTVAVPVLTGALLLAIAISAAGGGHGSYLPARIFFPYTMILSSVGERIGPVGVALAVVQYPAYGMALVAARSRGVSWKVFAWLAIVHGFCVILAFVLKTEYFPH